MRLAGLIAVAVLAWNAAFAATPRFGIFASVGLATALVLLRSLAVPTDWRALFTVDRSTRLLALGATALLIGGTALLRAPLFRLWPAFAGQVDALYRSVGPLSAFQAYVALPAIAAAEELIFRGVIQGGLEKRFGPWRAALLAAAIYALGHLASQTLVLIGLAAALGLFWGLLRARTGSLWPGLLSHMLWDLFAVVWAPMVPGAPHGP